jgi:hypothetical protein
VCCGDKKGSTLTCACWVCLHPPSFYSQSRPTHLTFDHPIPLHPRLPQSLLPALPSLAHLNLFKNWKFGDAQLIKSAVHLLGVQSLDLRGTWVTHRGLAELSQLSSLTKLALAPHVELRAEQTGVVAALSQLRSLTISCPSYSVWLMEAVAQLTGLRVGLWWLGLGGGLLSRWRALSGVLSSGFQ